MKILLLTPPFVQANTPYPATPSLCGFLRPLGYHVVQRDLSIEVLLDILTAYGEDPLTENVLAYLQGRNPDEAEVLADPETLPEGPAFAELDNIGPLEDVRECAGIRCSLYLDDLAAEITEQVDPDFGFSRYAERLCVDLPDFGILLRRLKRRGVVERFLEKRLLSILNAECPDIVGVTCPFPGTLLGAFRVAKCVRAWNPKVRMVLGGGYVSTELRAMDDPRVHRYFDDILYDEGYLPWLRILHDKRHLSPPLFVKPDYAGLDLSLYFNMTECANPMYRLWSEGRWLKLQMARGCYWHRCAFCDVCLDYIRSFAMPPATEIVDAMENLARETGENGFHFTDEAMPPKLIRDVSAEIIRRKFKCRWWGNIRFDASWTPQLARLAAHAGCIAVTGGLECATDRLLNLMNKGITLDSARMALKHLAHAGIMVHAYLMYGFPTERESEVKAALRYVRDCFRAGLITSAYFHRFALTVHSPIARDPSRFKIIPQILPTKKGRTFARNEIPFIDPAAPDWDRIGPILKRALYNFMNGNCLDKPISFWFKP